MAFNLYEEVRRGMLVKDKFNYGYDSLEQEMPPTQLLNYLNQQQVREQSLRLIFTVAGTENVETICRMLMK